MRIKAEGGSHLIAAALGDLYSPGFKRDLKNWLKSVPQYPKPFDMQFVPLTDVLDDMAGKFVDEECRKQCFDLTVRSGDEAGTTNIVAPEMVQKIFLLFEFLRNGTFSNPSFRTRS